MNVNENDWKLEMHRVLEIFEQESTSSLRKINRCFTALGRPFDEDFRQYYLEISKLRLESSFNTILFEQWNENRMLTSSTVPGDPSNADDIGNNLNLSSFKSDSGSHNALEKENTMELKIENNTDATVEISGLDDDGVVQYSGRREANVTIDNQQQSSVVVISMSESMVDQNQPSTSSSARKHTKRSDEKRFKCKHCAYTSEFKTNFQNHQLIHEGRKPFKCEHCDYAARQKHHLIAHQRTHNRQNLGIVRDPISGLYKCPYCDQQFVKWNSLGKHLTHTHKNNQCLFNCVRCMRRFTRKTEKDRHELQCQNHRYECYVCKKYICIRLFNMQRHMQIHTGEKSFECAVCNKRFRHKNTLNYHLDSIHNRINK